MGDWVQYSVVLAKGDDVGLERWVWCDRGVLDKIKNDVPDEKTFFETSFGKVVWCGGDHVRLISYTEEDVNRLAAAYEFPSPFLKKDGKYVFNPRGE